MVLYAGVLDVATNPRALEQAVGALSWRGAAALGGARKVRHTSRRRGATLGFSKRSGPLHVYWLLGAGHAALADNPELGAQMLRETVLGSARRQGPRPRDTDQVVEELEERQGMVQRSNDDAMARLDEYRREGDAGSPDGRGATSPEWMLDKVEAGGQQDSNDLLAYEKRMMRDAPPAELKELEKSVMHADVKDA